MDNKKRSKNLEKSKNSIFKIRNNSYNSGEIEYEVFGDFGIESNKNINENMQLFHDLSYNDYETKKLQDELYNIFKASKYFTKYTKTEKNKRVPKRKTMEVFYFFADKKQLRNNFLFHEIFKEINEFMRLDYKHVYFNLSPNDKQQIIKELEDKYKYISKKLGKRLF